MACMIRNFNQLWWLIVCLHFEESFLRTVLACSLDYEVYDMAEVYTSKFETCSKSFACTTTCICHPSTMVLKFLPLHFQMHMISPSNSTLAC